MSMSVILLVAVAALICTILNAIDKCPLWVAVLLLCVAVLLGVLPAR